MTDTEELLLQSKLDKDETKAHLYKALQSYENHLKKSGELKQSEELAKNIKTLFGLILYDKFDIDNLSASLVNTLFLVLNYYEKVIEDEMFVNDNLSYKIAKKIDEIVEEEDKKLEHEQEKEIKKPVYSDERLIQINLAHNKKVLIDAKVENNGRRFIYSMIEKWIDKHCVAGEKGKPGELKTKYYHLNFVAKLGEKGEHIYKINEIRKYKV